MKKTLIAIAAVLVGSMGHDLPAQAAPTYLACSVVRVDGSNAEPLKVNYTLNEAEGKISSHFPHSGSMNTYEAVYSADSIAATYKVAGFSSGVSIDRTNGVIVLDTAGFVSQGSCEPSQAPTRKF